MKKERGFSIVEISVALIIIGVLIGGILQAQQMVRSARVLSTVARIKTFEAATQKFNETYGGLPGDLIEADSKIKGCTSVCALDTTVATSGDGIVGLVGWSLTSGGFRAQIVDTYKPTGTAYAGFETLLFWYELNKAGLISVVNEDVAVEGNRVMFNKALPSAEVGGGFLVGYMQITNTAYKDKAGRPAGAGYYTIPGTVLAMVDIPDADLSTDQRQQSMTPSVAAQVDRKMDDGLPDKGEVQAFGWGDSCYGSGTPAYAYNESSSSKDCGLFVRISQ